MEKERRTKHVHVIVACDKNGGIGYEGKIPWKLHDDMKYFKKITLAAPDGQCNAIVMGRKTWESLPLKPLSNRINIVISSTCAKNEDCLVFKDLTSALSYANHQTCIYKIFVIGGSMLYEEALSCTLCRNVLVTHIDNEYICDVFFPLQKLQKDFILLKEGVVKQQNNIVYKFNEYERKKI